jgi:hypothetical protein
MEDVFIKVVFFLFAGCVAVIVILFFLVWIVRGIVSFLLLIYFFCVLFLGIPWLLFAPRKYIHRLREAWETIEIILLE